MSQTSTEQISAEAAEIYEAFYLPALFQEWTPRISPPDRDVAALRQAAQAGRADAQYRLAVL
jgi:hypothetical protein